MIITLLSIMLFGGGDSGPSWPIQDVIARIEMIDMGADRSYEATQGARDMDQALKTFAKEYKNAIKDLRAVHKRHDATAADYKAVIASAAEHRQTLAEDLVAARGRMRDALRPDEWEQVFIFDPSESASN